MPSGTSKTTRRDPVTGRARESVDLNVLAATVGDGSPPDNRVNWHYGPDINDPVVAFDTGSVSTSGYSIKTVAAQSVDGQRQTVLSLRSSTLPTGSPGLSTVANGLRLKVADEPTRSLYLYGGYSIFGQLGYTGRSFADIASVTVLANQLTGKVTIPHNWNVPSKTVDAGSSQATFPAVGVLANGIALGEATIGLSKDSDANNAVLSLRLLTTRSVDTTWTIFFQLIELST